ncbi:MAG: hypothetical protein C4B59_13080 [Candidatus Methanogaster sp.]|uniref:Uncharacterized protein n=1 Tax=Candidatus Methanogaster sp. TaxID=3386292 RepID=A0AC61L081_9EURY|nr:MAG: hypothetical protein C4B59_13080 [ANME-2 cluster archaeon]
MERIGEVLRNGAYTWKQNPILCAPFVLDTFAQFLFFALVFAGLVAVIGTDLFMAIGSGVSEIMHASQTPGEPSLDAAEAMVEVYQLAVPFIRVFIVALIIMGIGSALIRTFFEAGAVGMAKNATMAGTTRMNDLLWYGRRSTISLFLANILILLIFLAGIVFLVPGILLLDASDGNGVAMAAFAIGIILWIGYMIILSIGLAPVTYALVIDNKGPIEGIEKGWKFFSSHKLDVFLMWVVMFAIAMLVFTVGQIFFIHPVTTVIWQFVATLINICILMPLITVWWTRLYLSRSAGRRLRQALRNKH